MVSKLSNKQQKFCDEYLIDLNSAQAAIRAGYSAKTARTVGSENLTKPAIQEYIHTRRAAISEKAELNSLWVLARLKEISDRCMQAEPVMIRGEEGEMIESGEYRFDSAGANKSTELIGKHLGMFGDKLDVTSKGQQMKMITGFKVVHVKPQANAH